MSTLDTDLKGNKSPYGGFEDFSRRNRIRCTSPEGFNHSLDSWSSSDWMVALVGEIGEAANIVKKLNRIRDGIQNKKGETAEELLENLKGELADSFTYLDLFCQSKGINLLEEAEKKFITVSNEIGYVEK